jgi:hypothetical protein
MCACPSPAGNTPAGAAAAGAMDGSRAAGDSSTPANAAGNSSSGAAAAATAGGTGKRAKKKAVRSNQKAAQAPAPAAVPDEATLQVCWDGGRFLLYSSTVQLCGPADCCQLHCTVVLYCCATTVQLSVPKPACVVGVVQGGFSCWRLRLHPSSCNTCPVLVSLVLVATLHQHPPSCCCYCCRHVPCQF